VKKMNALTLTKTPVEAPVLPELERPDADQIGDEILLASAASTKVAKVTAGGIGRNQSAQSRAWTLGGRVD
jgi:hypothetical protein